MAERDASLVRREGAARRPGATGASTAIPDKLYFRIGEVAALAGVPAYVLRYWQTEFPQLQPKKSGSGQRLYRQREVELVLRIRDLLYRERFTIEGAKRELARDERGGKPAEDLLSSLARLREGLEGLASSLGPVAASMGSRATGRR
jgi:DNA-binding transcriptional MerR regulator